MTFPRIWVIPGNRPGDDAQVYALAEELGLPFETRKLVFNGGFWLVARSARTSEAALDRIEAELEGARCEWRVVRNEFPRFPVLLADGDALFPTADSISMTSESIIAGKPVGIVPVEMNLLGRIALGARVDERNPMRDLRRFWTYVLDRKLAGWMHETLASKTAKPVTAAASEVRELIESGVGKSGD